jgi:hypothetical protein
MKNALNVYLAGPITNCSERQKTEWRKRMKAALVREGYRCVDPTDERARKGALAVTADIEEADVVIANMWRESIGTAIGIVQARRMGIPVILIDPNYIDSPILGSIVGDAVVHDEAAALHKLQKEVAQSLSREITVTKRDGSTVAFDLKKLQKSLKAACLQAGVDDPIFHILLSRRVQRAIYASASSEPIKTETIRDRVFQELQKISHDAQFAGEEERQLLDHATALQYAWEFHEKLVKEQVRDLQQEEADYLAEIDELSGQLSERELEIENLRARLHTQVDNARPRSRPATPQEPQSSDVAARIESALGNKHGLCIGRIGKASFASAFARRGVSQDDFDRLFEEKALEGKQSNLNSDLKRYIKSYPFVLYACDGLRHLSDAKLRTAPNLIAGAGPNDAVRKFVMRLPRNEGKLTL